MGHKRAIACSDSAIRYRFVDFADVWRNQIPTGETRPDGTMVEIADPGHVVVLGGEKLRLTTTAWQASFTFSEEFRDSLVQMVAKMTPREVFTGDTQTVLIFQAVTLPEPNGEGEWKVQVVGNLLKQSKSSGTSSSIPFNKEILIRAIDTPPLPEEGKVASPLEQAIAFHSGIWP